LTPGERLCRFDSTCGSIEEGGGVSMKDFLLRLEDDDDLRSRFRKSPEEVAQAEGLTADQAAALASKNPKQIRQALQEESPGESIVSVVMVE
jgi:hypothetical protein